MGRPPPRCRVRFVADPGHPQVVQQDREHRSVTGLACAHEHDQGQPAPIDQVVNFAAQAAAGSPDRMITGLVEQG